MISLFEELNIKFSDAIDNFLLTELSAKKGELRTRDDLKKFTFKCFGCKEIKPATEATLVQLPLEIDLNEGIANVRQRMGLFCSTCNSYLTVK